MTTTRPRLGIFGWGLVGLCPGPAIVNLATLLPQVFVFVIAMGAGIVGLDWLRGGRKRY